MSICVHVLKEKIHPRGKTPTTAWGKLPMRVGVLPHGIVNGNLATIIVAMDT